MRTRRIALPKRSRHESGRTARLRFVRALTMVADPCIHVDPTLLARQPDAGRRAHSRLRFDAQLAAVSLHDAQRDRQAEARSARARSHERLEQSIENLRRDARPGIADLDDHPARPLLLSGAQPPAM